MDSLQLLAGFIGLIAYVPLIIGVIRGSIKQSFATYALWAGIDLIAAITIILQGGNYILSLLYGVCAAIVAVSLYTKKIRIWSWVEWMSSALVLICIIIWYMSGNKAATTASTLAAVIAGIPQTVAVYKKPTDAPIGIYSIFLAANCLSLYAGKAWTIEERFYPGAMAVATIVIIGFGLRRK